MIVENIFEAKARLFEMRAARDRLVVRRDRERAEAIASNRQTISATAIIDADPVARRHCPDGR